VETVLGLNVDISPKIKSVGFHVIPKRWVVEKTISSQEAMIKISHIHTLLKRL
jgi:hypothetical protein